MAWKCFITMSVTLLAVSESNAFSVGAKSEARRTSPIGSSASSAVESITEGFDEAARKRQYLRTQMLQMGASYNRGFGASSKARQDAEDLIRQLEASNEETDAARGIDGGLDSPLIGNWVMVWTTAQDVLVLGANPLVTVGAIYQIFQPPVVTNVIDLLPRAQNLLPIPSSLLRAKVATRSSSRAGLPMRVGLDFESVNLQPQEFLGQSALSLPPLGFDLPKLFDLPDDVGYFDVTFLDEDMLIIRQNAPGGLFVLARSESAEP